VFALLKSLQFRFEICGGILADIGHRDVVMPPYVQSLSQPELIMLEFAAILALEFSPLSPVLILPDDASVPTDLSHRYLL
jgi:hypothetical protein